MGCHNISIILFFFAFRVDTNVIKLLVLINFFLIFQDDIAKAFSQDIKEGSEEKLCQDLIEEAITKASKDNITCMIVKFRNKTE